MENRSHAMPEGESPNVGRPLADSPAIQPPQSEAGVSTHSIVGAIENTLGGGPKPSDALTGQPSLTKSRGDLPEVFGRYRVQKKLGSGAMGAVYLAEDTLLQRKVALKTPTFHDDTDGELLKRFYREARAVANLKHPNLCAVYDVGELDGRHYISMEYVPGKKLLEFIKPDSPMSEKQAMAVVRKIALGMHEAHKHGVIHRDLKPDNIMINDKGDPVVMDFGLVHKAESRESAKLTQQGSLIGSPAYMSKEQVEGDPEKLTAATDQYSLGVILYQLLTCCLPFEGGIHAVLAGILTREPPAPRQFRSDLNPHLEAVCMKMMAKEVKDRYRSMKAAADAIAEVAKGTSKTSETEAAAVFSNGTLTGSETELNASESTTPERIKAAGSLVSDSGDQVVNPLTSQAAKSPTATRRSLVANLSGIAAWWIRQRTAVRWATLGGSGILFLAMAAILYAKISNDAARKDLNDAELSAIPDRDAVAADNSIAANNNGPRASVTSESKVDLPPSKSELKGFPPALQTLAVSPSDLDRIATGNWIPLDYSTGVLSFPQPLNVQNGVLELKRGKITFPGIVASDVIVRAEVLKLSGLNMSLNLRSAVDTQPSRWYGAWFNGTQSDGGDLFGIGKQGGKSWTNLQIGRLGRKFGRREFVQLAISANGPMLTMFVNGKMVHTVRDSEYTRGTIWIGGNGLFRNAEFQILDPLAERDK
jgi:serine/threonine protein kinase